MNYKALQLAFTLLICTQLHSAERPPQPPASKKLPTFEQMFEQEEKQNKAMRERLSTLPRELRQDILNRYFFASYPNMNAIANRIIAFKDQITVDEMLQFFNALPYTANAITLAERLQNNSTTVPLMQNQRIIAWLEQAQKRLENGEELHTAVVINAPYKNLLTNKDLNLNWKNYWGQTALQAAISNNHIKSVHRLLNAGVDPDTALRHVINLGSLDLIRMALVKILLLAGANPNFKGDMGRTVLMNAAKKDHTELVKALLEFGATLDLQDNTGKTALMYAASKGNATIAWLLLQAGANPDLKDKDGDTALIVAVNNFNRDVVEIFLNAGADPNLKDRHGQTALMRAVALNSTLIARALLEAGADPDPQDDNGRTASTMVYSSKMAKILEDASLARKQKEEKITPGCAIS